MVFGGRGSLEIIGFCGEVQVGVQDTGWQFTWVDGRAFLERGTDAGKKSWGLKNGQTNSL